MRIVPQLLAALAVIQALAPASAGPANSGLKGLAARDGIYRCWRLDPAAPPVVSGAPVSADVLFTLGRTVIDRDSGETAFLYGFGLANAGVSALMPIQGGGCADVRGDIRCAPDCAGAGFQIVPARGGTTLELAPDGGAFRFGGTGACGSTVSLAPPAGGSALAMVETTPADCAPMLAPLDLLPPG